MYIPRHFALDDRGQQLAFIEDHSFGTLVTSNQGRLEINSIPFLLDRENECLLCHVARQNTHWQLVEAAEDLKVIFNGPDAYISPNWYGNPQNVPTWNFSSVQVSGKASLLDREDLLQLLDRLSQKHEAQFAEPWQIDKLEEKKLNAMLKAIVGIRISLDTVEGKAKLSQNKSSQEFNNVVEGLSRQSDAGSKQVTAMMRKGRRG